MKRKRTFIKRRTRTTFGENKYFDLHVGALALSIDGNYSTDQNFPLTIHPIPQGSGASQRIGRRLTLSSIHVRASFTFHNSSQPTCRVRFIIYQDKQCNGTGLARVNAMDTDNPAFDLLQPHSVTRNNMTTRTVNYLSYYNLFNRDRFKILLDKFIVLNAMYKDGTSHVSGGQTLRWNLDCNIPIEMTQTAAGVATNVSNITSNNIGVLPIAEFGAIVHSDIYTRVRFVDS